MPNLSRLWLAGVSLLSLGLGACSGPVLKEAFAPDPRLLERQIAPTDPSESSASGEPVTDTQAGERPAERVADNPEAGNEPLALAAAFPRQDIPLYPQRGPLQWQEINSAALRGQARWVLETSGEEALRFYAAELAKAGWDIDDTSPAGTIAAQKDPWQLEVKADKRRLTLRYQALRELEEIEVAANSSDRLPAAATAEADEQETAQPAPSQVVAIASKTFDDLQTAPAPLQKPLQEVTALGVLTPVAPKTATFAPDRPVSRRTFARWLITAHDRFWGDRPEWQIRPASAESKPLFTDVPTDDPDFISIQSLAMAGILPSTLSDDNGPTTFEPDAPLTRETLLAWKVPLDWHRGLPAVGADSVRETWGFQDADRIAAINQAAIVADHKSDEFANLRRLYGYTQLLQPQQPVTRAEAAVALWFFGTDADSGRSAAQLLAAEIETAAKDTVPEPE